MDIDEGYRLLDDLIETFGILKLDDANEAETRKKVIDDILEKILGWQPVSDISYEKRISEDGHTEYADYIIQTASTSIVIEAKRVGRSFTLPINKTSGILGRVLSEGEVGEAIRQVRDYARKESIPFAAVTNGSAWVVFPAVRTDRVSFEKTRAVVFRGLEDIKARFIEFWELLSRQRVIEGNLETQFFGNAKNDIQRRLLSQLSEPGFRLGRNSVYEFIEPAIAAALTDESLLEDVEALEACYVKSTERVKYDSRLKMHLRDIKPNLDRKVVRPKLKRKDSKHLDYRISKIETSRPQFILLLGPVGAGKTTFLHYTKKISAKEAVDGKVLWLNVDFKRATEHDNPREFLYGELLRLIEEDKEYDLGSWDGGIRPAYDNLVETLKNGSLKLLFDSDRKAFQSRVAEKINEERDKIEPYVNTILNHAATEIPIFMVVDNVDQLQSEDYQNRVFIETQAAARKIGCSAIMALRDSTYMKHKNTPVFDAFQVDTIYIDPPPVLPVLTRRFHYAKKVIEGRSATIVSESGSLLSQRLM